MIQIALKKLCPRCHKLIDISMAYCSDCQVKVDAEREAFFARRNPEKDKQRHKYYKANRTDKKEQRFYSGKDWDVLKQYLASQYHGMCVVTYVRDHLIVPFYTMHHIVEVKDDWNRRFDPKNIIPVSESVHQKIHRLYQTSHKQETQAMLFKILEEFNEPKRKV